MTVLARRSLLLLVLALSCFAFALVMSAQQASSATSFKTCSLSSKDKQPGKHGPTYLKKLKVKGPSCADGKDYVRAYYNCRTKGSKPKTGKCTNPPHGYDCDEDRYANSQTSYDALVQCTKGSKRVDHRYQQFK